MSKEYCRDVGKKFIGKRKSCRSAKRLTNSIKEVTGLPIATVERLAKDILMGTKPKIQVGEAGVRIREEFESKGAVQLAWTF